MNRRSFLQAATLATVATPIGLSIRPAAAASYDDYTAALRAPLRPDGDIADIVRQATLAPNGHNTQSWMFTIADRAITIRADLDRRTPVVDPDDHHIFVSLGCAAENLALAAAATGRRGQFDIADDGTVRYDWHPGSASVDPLVDAIRQRQSTRSLYDGQPVETSVLRQLETAAAADGVRVVIVADRPRLDSVRDLIVAGNRRQLADPAFVAELKSWIRYSRSSAMDHGDGLFGPATGNPAVPDFIGRLAFGLVFDAAAEDDKCAAQMNSSSGVAVFLGDRADHRHWVKVGRAAERFLLTATRLGLATAFLNQPVEVPQLRPDLARLVGEAALRPDLLVRFGRAAPMPFSPRRPVASVMVPA